MYEKVGLNRNGFKHLDNVSLDNGSVGGLGPNIRIDVYINLFDDIRFGSFEISYVKRFA